MKKINPYAGVPLPAPLPEPPPTDPALLTELARTTAGRAATGLGGAARAAAGSPRLLLKLWARAGGARTGGSHTAGSCETGSSYPTVSLPSTGAARAARSVHVVAGVARNNSFGGKMAHQSRRAQRRAPP